MTHPVTRFDREPVPEEAVRGLQGRSEPELRSVFVAEKRDSVVRAARFEQAARATVSLWVLSGEPRYRDLAVSAYCSALGDLRHQSEGFFWRQVTHRGSIEHLNDYARGLVSTTDLYALRDACEHFAMLYFLAGEQAAALRSAILLARFAEQLPRWPVYYPTRADLSTEKAGAWSGTWTGGTTSRFTPRGGPG